MISGKVLGPVWSTKRVEGVPAGAFLRVQVAETNAQLVALDLLGSGIGDTVLIAQGSVVSDSLPGKAPIDALIIGLIDETTTNEGK